MKKQDIFEKWEPVENFLKDIYLYDLQEDGGVLSISLKKLDVENQTLILKFKSVLCYRVTDESSRNRTIHNNPMFRGLRTSSDSEFLRWFVEENGGIHKLEEVQHYLICNIDSVIDIISGIPPLIEFVNGSIMPISTE